ncbi:probable calcium-binding CML41 [Olea europaea subsp. europaea]|uniref:Probable calcium-binding CML41 n=1 Tax=Olea europaea subsp. europaea TaxID=158383 RepID=A0A8S0V6S1_OLEEU|nr:probable calcium-binding CML41 [Olea europaea subsp. europaea]
MEPIKISRSFRSFSPKKLTLSLLQSISKSKSKSLSSPRTPKSPITTPRRNSSSNNSREEEYKEVFRRFDGDNDGKISAHELRSYFESVGEYMSHEDAEIVINNLDTDKDNFLDFQDFMKLMEKEGEEEDLKRAFEIFELEKGSGRITPRSLQRVLSRLGDSKSYDECVAMIQVYDMDGNGELDYQEFQQMMMA